MRLILARVIYNFDMVAAEAGEDWIRKQKAYAMWEKVPLMVYLTPRVKS